MRILQTPVRLYATGGVESYVLNLSRELENKGHSVSVICSESAREMECDNNISVKALWSMGKIANTNITPGLPLALLREDFDLIHTHLPTPWSADWSALVSLIKNKPLVLTYHNDIVGTGYAEYAARFYNFTALRTLLARAKKILVARPRHVSLRLGPYRDKVKFVPVGVDAEAFRPQRTEEIGDIFFLSVLDEFHLYKGLDVLLASLKAVKEKFPEVTLVVGGSGALLENYRNLAQDLGLSENVRFEGYIPRGRLYELYNGCKLFVLPSLSAEQEGFGIVPMEAMACSRPVVITEIAGVAEDVATRGAGIVVSPGDAQALARAIIAILEDEQIGSEMGLAGRKLIEEKYSWKNVAGQVERIYREVV